MMNFYSTVQSINKSMTHLFTKSLFNAKKKKKKVWPKQMAATIAPFLRINFTQKKSTDCVPLQFGPTR